MESEGSAKKTMLLELDHVQVQFEDAPVLQDLSFCLDEGEILGLVGESGSGKSMTALTIMGLLPDDIHLESGSIYFQGQDLEALDPKRRRRMLGKDIAMIFQDPMTSLNPLYTIGHQLVEALQIHHPEVSKEVALNLARQRLKEVELDEPEASLKKYPHQFSGGQRQRICIAMALMNVPKLLIADEATTALDVTVQYHILELLRELSRKYQMSLIVVSHNLALIHHLCERVIVLYTGRILEHGTVDEVFHSPRHPYTAELLQAIPENAVKGQPIPTIPGQVPSLLDEKPLCPFYDRCFFHQASCLVPPLTCHSFSKTHEVYFARADETAELFERRFS